MALTAKQDNFCKNIVSGMINKDAYMAAYDCQSEKAAWIESTKLLQRDDIQARIKALRLPLEAAIVSQAQNARQEQIEYIINRRKICEQKEDEQSIIRYTDQLNKLYGLYTDTATEEKREQTTAQLDTDTLRKLAGTA